MKALCILLRCFARPHGLLRASQGLLDLRDAVEAILHAVKSLPLLEPHSLKLLIEGVVDSRDLVLQKLHLDLLAPPHMQLKVRIQQLACPILDLDA